MFCGKHFEIADGVEVVLVSEFVFAAVEVCFFIEPFDFDGWPKWDMRFAIVWDDLDELSYEEFVVAVDEESVAYVVYFRVGFDRGVRYGRVYNGIYFFETGFVFDKGR